MNQLISAMANAFRGHGFSLLVATLLRGLQLMLFPQKTPPALQSTSVRMSVKIMNVAFKTQLYLKRKSCHKEARANEAKRQVELNQDPVDHGKKPFSSEKFGKEEMKEINVSMTDPESGYYVKDVRIKQFTYSFHAAADRFGFLRGHCHTWKCSWIVICFNHLSKRQKKV